MQTRAKRRQNDEQWGKKKSKPSCPLEPEEEAMVSSSELDLKQWFRAVSRGFEKKVTQLLAAHPELIKTRAPGKAALHLAAFNGRDNIIPHLLTADPTLIDAIDEQGALALHLAAGRGHDKVVELLLAAKSWPSAIDFDERTALHYAASSRSCRTVELLLAACPALIDAVDFRGSTALLHALAEKDEALAVQLLTANPKNLDAMNSSGRNALHYAIALGKETIIWRLLALQPELISVATENGITPLHMVLVHASDNTQMIQRFYTLCPQATSMRRHQTLLFAAVQDESDFCIDLFMPSSTFDQIVRAFTQAFNLPEEKKNFRPRVEAQCTPPLSMFLNQDVINTVYEYLFGQATKQPVKAKTPEDAPRKRRWFKAVSKGDARTVAQLLAEDPNLIDAVYNADADFQSRIVVGSTALQIAAAHGFPGIAKQLVAANPSKVEVADPQGYTALHLAASNSRDDIIEILLAASPTMGLLATEEGTTPLMEAAVAGSVRGVELLLAASPGALDMLDLDETTALLNASFNDHHEIVSLLLAANPLNVAETDCQGWNSLHHAVSNGHLEHVEKLLEIEPRLIRTRMEESRETPLFIAVEREHEELIKFLFHRFPQAVRIGNKADITPYFLAVQTANTFAIELFQPKLSFDEISRGFRKRDIFLKSSTGYEEEFRHTFRSQCMKELCTLTPSIVNIVAGFIGLDLTS